MPVTSPTPPHVTVVGAPPKLRSIALAGNPNAGKTTLFNALTGLRHKVGNYPGVTVEKKEGRADLGGIEATILDVPGTYSLSPKSPDEEIARDVLLGLRDDTEVPDAVLIVIDASNLERNLYFATQVLEIGLPSIVALNMTDVADTNGKPVDAAALSQALGATVVPIIASKGEGLDSLKAALAGTISVPHPPALTLPAKLDAARATLAAELMASSAVPVTNSSGVALRLLCGNVDLGRVGAHYGQGVARALAAARESVGVPAAQLGALEAGARYAMLAPLTRKVVAVPAAPARSFTDKADSILTHRVWGLVIFAVLTLLVFQAIFSFATIPMDWIDGRTSDLKDLVGRTLPVGPLADLLANGVIAGVGAVVIFLPQIMILFLFIGLLEDTGYMARAAFLMDRMMSKVGLHGRAFIPLLSSFACAIPGIMAARTISSNRDRMTTILIAPLMTCSARLPVYLLMIGAFIPDARIWGVFSRSALIMFSLYVAGVAAAMLAAWVFKKTLFKGPPPALMLELPPYKVPVMRDVLLQVWDRSSQFLKRAGTVILAISIILWALLAYPKMDPATMKAQLDAAAASDIKLGMHTAPTPDGEEAPDAATVREERAKALAMDHSIGGRIGHAVEPIIKPLGYNWKIGIGLIGALSAREVFVSTLGTVYSVGDEADETSTPLKEAMKNDRWPDGQPVWTPLVAVSLMVYFVLAMQCMSTLAVVKRETNSWTWPLFMLAYMTGAAWIAAFAVYQVGRALGWG